MLIDTDDDECANKHGYGENNIRSVVKIKLEVSEK